MEIGKNSVVIGNVPSNIRTGEGSVVIGPTHSSGSINITEPMAVGNGAEADKTSIAIGAFSKAGITNNSSEIKPVPNSAANPPRDIEPNGSKNPNKPNLLMSPIGYVWLTAIGGVITAAILYLIYYHFGISL